MKCLPCMRRKGGGGVCMCAFVTFYINLYISFIHQDIFSKFAENVDGCENMSMNNFVLILRNNMAAIVNCLKIIDMF